MTRPVVGRVTKMLYLPVVASTVLNCDAVPPVTVKLAKLRPLIGSPNVTVTVKFNWFVGIEELVVNTGAGAVLSGSAER